MYSRRSPADAAQDPKEQGQLIALLTVIQCMNITTSRTSSLPMNHVYCVAVHCLFMEIEILIHKSYDNLSFPGKSTARKYHGESTREWT